MSQQITVMKISRAVSAPDTAGTSRSRTAVLGNFAHQLGARELYGSPAACNTVSQPRSSVRSSTPSAIVFVSEGPRECREESRPRRACAHSQRGQAIAHVPTSYIAGPFARDLAENFMRSGNREQRLRLGSATRPRQEAKSVAAVDEVEVARCDRGQTSQGNGNRGLSSWNHRVARSVYSNSGEDKPQLANCVIGQSGLFARKESSSADTKRYDSNGKQVYIAASERVRTLRGRRFPDMLQNVAVARPWTYLFFAFCCTRAMTNSSTACIECSCRLTRSAHVRDGEPASDSSLSVCSTGLYEPRWSARGARLGANCASNWPLPLSQAYKTATTLVIQTDHARQGNSGSARMNLHP